jgi:hypothetical protein
MEALVVMFAHPDVWIEAADKKVICEFPSQWPGDEGRDFEDRKLLAYQVKECLMFKPLPTTKMFRGINDPDGIVGR